MNSSKPLAHTPCSGWGQPSKQAFFCSPPSSHNSLSSSTPSPPLNTSFYPPSSPFPSRLQQPPPPIPYSFLSKPPSIPSFSGLPLPPDPAVIFAKPVSRRHKKKSFQNAPSSSPFKLLESIDIHKAIRVEHQNKMPATVSQYDYCFGKYLRVLKGISEEFESDTTTPRSQTDIDNIRSLEDESLITQWKVDLFLMKMLTNYGISEGTVRSYCSAINYYGSFQKPVFSCAESSVRMFVDIASRSGSAELKQAEAITLQSLLDVRDYLLTSSSFQSGNIRNQVWVMMVMMFFGFFRIKELTSLTRDCLVFSIDEKLSCKVLEITLKTSKRRKTAEKVYIFERHQPGQVSPVTIIAEFVQGLENCQPLFEWTTKSFNYHFRQLIEEVKHSNPSSFGHPAEVYSSHSMRRGGNQAAESHEVPQAHRNKHGRWIPFQDPDRSVGSTHYNNRCPRESAYIVTTKISEHPTQVV